MKVTKILIIVLVITISSFAGVSLFYSHLITNLTTIKPLQKTVGTVKNESSINKTEKRNAIKSDSAGYEVILKRNIFQSLTGNKLPPPIEPADETIEKTSLKLELLGTVFSNRDSAKRAIIIDGKTRKQGIYHLGDTLHGSIIKEILRGKVILEVSGKREALLLKDRKGGGPGPLAIERDVESRRKVTVSEVINNGQPEKRHPVIRPRRRIPLDTNNSEESQNAVNWSGNQFTEKINDSSLNTSEEQEESINEGNVQREGNEDGP